eukprot:m.12988 g.12988  ORF g.12988 m.12988 type:complete len:562 (-) comp9546_c0_seq1:135-1820(-)
MIMASPNKIPFLLTLVVCICPSSSDSTTPNPPRSQTGLKKLVNFNNDLTNTYSNVSPFHAKGAPFDSQVLNGSISETRRLGLNAHILAPGLCWVAWWDSKIAPPRVYDAWMRSTFNYTNQSHQTSTGNIFSYVLQGGDILGEFVKLANENGQRPTVSFRINDLQSCNKPPVQNYGAMSQFWYDHRHDQGIMENGKAFNDTCCFEQKCECSCYTGGASMVLGSEAVLHDRLQLMLEILTLYPGVDFEIDLERWVWIFNQAATNSSRRHAIMADLLRTLRGGMAPGARLGLRVPADSNLLDSLGVDLKMLSSDPTIKLDYATFGVSFFAELASTTDFASLRSQLAMPLLFELSELHEQIFLSHNPTKELLQLLTAEQLSTVALDAYALGADGISTFNFQYYRTMGIEPLYDTLSHLGDEDWVDRSSQYWFWTTGTSSSSSGSHRTLPVVLAPDKNDSISVRIATPKTTTYVSVGILRLQTTKKWAAPLNATRVALNGVWLVATANTTRVYHSLIPDIHVGNYAAFVVPTDLVYNGRNNVTIECVSAMCNGVEVNGLEMQLPTH